MGYLREIWQQQETDTFDSSGQQARRHDNDHQQYQQQRHQDFRCPLNAMSYAADDNQMGDEHEDDTP